MRLHPLITQRIVMIFITIAEDVGTNPGTGLTPDFPFLAEGGPRPTKPKSGRRGPLLRATMRCSSEVIGSLRITVNTVAI